MTDCLLPSETERLNPGFRHEALIYSDPDQFLAATVPFLIGALEAGEAAVVAVSERNTELLRAELGADAEEVGFVAMEELGRNPARILPFWRDFVDESTGRPARGIGEPLWPGRDIAEVDECQRHESLLDLAFSPGPSWSLLCPYDGAALPDEVLAAVSHSHRSVAHDGVAEASGGYLAETDCFGGELPRHAVDADLLAYDRSRLSAVRRHVERAAKGAGISPQGTADLVVAASELAANSVAHGGGAGTLRSWRQGNRLLIEFEDRGRIAEPLAGRERPTLTQEGGRGLWLVNQLCDLVQIRSSELGTTVRLQAATG
ncbi:MAG TPA: sensor histidine kinase [Solirubrobacterales bacterium]|nr:sensor histidine kinase [Solirubrobacterales bacterium]